MNEGKSPHLPNIKKDQIYGQSKTRNSISTKLEPISFQDGNYCIESARNTCSNSQHHTPKTHVIQNSINNCTFQGNIYNARRTRREFLSHLHI